MDIVQLQQLLTFNEHPKLEFKREWYTSSDKLDNKGWGEFLKDIISLANGNIGYAGEPGYLIIGVSDVDPFPNTSRNIFHIEAVGMLSQLQKLRDTTLRKVQSTCSPSLPDITFDFISIEDNKKILVITIPPPAGVLKLDRDLNTRGMYFRKGTVLIRVGQDISVADPTEIVALQTEYRKDILVESNKIRHNLPQPDYISFIGRKEELNKLRQLLHPNDRIWTVVIDGLGGIGKTALALEIAHRYLQEYNQLPKDERFEVIIWVSAKSTVLTVNGIKARQQVTNTISDIYKTIAVVFEEEDRVTHLDDLDDQNRFILRALTRQRTLLIIDNLETIDDERINAFIRELPNPTKCIVTTRHRIDVADPIRLSAMPKDDALLLIDQECKKKKVQLTNQEIDLLYKRTGGVPLAVVWSIAQISYHGHNVETVLHQLGNAKGDIARFCFEGAVKIIKNRPSHMLLICLSISSYSSTRQYLGEIANLSELDRDEGLVELEKLSLINKQQDKFSILPLVREYIIASVDDYSFEELVEIIIRITEFYPPAGAEPIILIEPIFSKKKLIELKEKVTQMIIDQMWEWEGQYDELGVSYCAIALEELNTKTAKTAMSQMATYYGEG